MDFHNCCGSGIETLEASPVFSGFILIFTTAAEAALKLDNQGYLLSNYRIFTTAAEAALKRRELDVICNILTMIFTTAAEAALKQSHGAVATFSFDEIFTTAAEAALKLCDKKIYKSWSLIFTTAAEAALKQGVLKFLFCFCYDFHNCCKSGIETIIQREQ